MTFSNNKNNYYYRTTDFVLDYQIVIIISIYRYVYDIPSYCIGDLELMIFTILTILIHTANTFIYLLYKIILL